MSLEVGVFAVEVDGFFEAFGRKVEFQLAAVDQAEAVMQVGVGGLDLDGGFEGFDGAAGVASRASWAARPPRNGHRLLRHRL